MHACIFANKTKSTQIRAVDAFFSCQSGAKKNSKNIAEDQGQSECHTMSSNKMSADSKETAEMSCLDAPAEQNKKKKRRAEGRPHKRLLEPLLFKRKEDVRRKLQVHKAKCVLLQERLDLYERESELRAEPE